MNNNMMMMLPLLMGMNGDKNANMTELVMSMLKQSSGDAGQAAGINPMMPLMMSMMSMMGGKNGAKNEGRENDKKQADFDAIKNFSGADVMEAMKILMQRKGGV